MKPPTSSSDSLSVGDKLLVGAVVTVLLLLIIFIFWFFSGQFASVPAALPTATPDPLLLAIPTLSIDEGEDIFVPTIDPSAGPTYTPHPTPRSQVLSSNTRYMTIVNDQLWFITNGQKFNTVEVRWVGVDSNHTVQVGELVTVDEAAILAAVVGDNKLFVSQLPNQTATMKLWQLTAGPTPPAEDENPITLTIYQPAQQATLGNLTLFAQADDNGDVELWKKEGDQPAELFVDLNNVASSNPQHFTVFQQWVFFTATDRHNDTELWRTDGTAPGTMRVKDINPSFSSAPADLIVFGDYLFFTADDWNNGRELWRTDGTEENTIIFANISR